MSRKSVHLYIHLKWFEQFRVLQFGWRLAKVIFHNNKDFLVILDLIKEFGDVILCHPSAQNVEIFLVILHARRKFTNVKVVGQFFQTFLRRDKLRSAFCQHFCRFFIQIPNLIFHLADLTVETHKCFRRRTVKSALQRYPLKMKRAEYRIDFQ